MKKFFTIALIIVALVVTLGGFYFYSILPAAEEHAMYNQARLVETIEQQLKDVDLPTIRQKAPLILEKNVEELQANIQEGKLTYEELTAFYLDRIKTFDQRDKGINAVSEVNPDVLNQARLLDKKAMQKPATLYGIPVLLKENINTKTMVTSGGVYAFRNFIPEEDAEVVQHLVAQDALILGKTNLSEFANYMSYKMPSGFSDKHGQTLNPYYPLQLSPYGSSSGSAAGITANLAAVSLGTETTGSIIAPAAVQSVVGFKPSHGSVSGEGVLPLAHSLDVVGPITRNVTDAAIVYRSIQQTETATEDLPELKVDALAQKRVGYVKTSDDALNEQLKKQLESLQATPIEVTFDDTKIDNSAVIDNEFKHDFEAYAKRYDLPIKTLAEVVDYNTQDMEVRAKYGQTLVIEASKAKSYDEKISRKNVEAAEKAYQEVYATNKLDLIVYFDNESAVVTASAGAPEVTVPFGLDQEGTPRGITFTMPKGKDWQALQYAYAFEQATKARVVLSDEQLTKNLDQAK